MYELYMPGKNLLIDESMMLFRGRLILRQYIKNTQYDLCTSDGLILRISIYSGQTEHEITSADVVLDLI